MCLGTNFRLRVQPAEEAVRDARPDLVCWTQPFKSRSREAREGLGAKAAGDAANRRQLEERVRHQEAQIRALHDKMNELMEDVAHYRRVAADAERASASAARGNITHAAGPPRTEARR